MIFGRPFGQGFQQIAGFEGRAEIGRFSVFARGEYQHSPAVPGYNANVNQSLAAIDGIPGETLNGVPSRNGFRLLDTYASFNLLSNEISVGKQTYWVGSVYRYSRECLAPFAVTISLDGYMAIDPDVQEIPKSGCCSDRWRTQGQ